MFGPAFMVAPVYEYGARSREVYFPECEGWYDFYTNKMVSGGVGRMVDAPYGRMPLYVRAGSIVPVGPDMQWSDEKPADILDVYVYKGADGTFTLYEDENVNYNYEKGLYSTIDFFYDDSEQTLTIAKRNGEFSGMPDKRTFNIIAVSDGKAETVASVIYDGGNEVVVDCQ